MAISRTEAVADGATNVFTVSFPYLDESHVFVWTKGVGETFFTQYTAGFSFNSPVEIQLNTTPANGVVVQVRRMTPCDDLLATLTSPSTLSDDEINLVNTQLLYLIQENKDASEGFDTGYIDILSLLRFTYDIALSGPAQFGNMDILGPVPVTENITLAVDLAGSQFAGPLGGNPSSNHVLTLYTAEADGSNATAHGTITVSAAGVVTPDVPAITQIAAGSIVYLQTTTAAGLQNFGVTLRGFRS